MLASNNSAKRKANSEDAAVSEEEEAGGPTKKKNGSKKSAKTARASFTLPRSIFNQFKKASKLTGASSHAEVVRQALKIYFLLLEEKSNGNKVTVTRESDQAIVDITPFL